MVLVPVVARATHDKDARVTVDWVGLGNGTGDAQSCGSNKGDQHV